MLCFLPVATYDSWNAVFPRPCGGGLTAGKSGYLRMGSVISYPDVVM